MTNRVSRAKARFLLAVPAVVLATRPALAIVNVSGGVDPVTGMTTLGAWIFSLVGITIPLICGWKGVHAVAEGRHLGPYIGSAVGGMILAFGGAYILRNYGVT